MPRRDPWLNAGIFLTTFATLLMELMDSRLLSVLTWYHLSFFAVSVAMLGMASGAVLVFMAGRRIAGERARRLLGRIALAFAFSIPLSHLVLLRMRIPRISDLEIVQMLPLAIATVLLTIPFLLSGVVVTIALTRAGGRIGVVYGFDLLGAAAGCLLLVPLLHALDLMSAVLAAGALAAAGALCFARFAGTRPTAAAIAAGLLLAGAATHAMSDAPIDVGYPKGKALDRSRLERSEWNAYSHVVVEKPTLRPPFFWGAGRHPDGLSVWIAQMLTDGQASTALTEWDGNSTSLSWVQYDVTSLPYHLRSGDVGIIGVGGGRDVLSALWGGATSVTAVEMNGIYVDVLRNHYRDFVNLADRDGIELVHDEARSYFARTSARFDVIQMSLVDTWAATGAGAFTLSENALYTVEGWKVFMGRLAPDGIFSTSRWFSSAKISETSRLLSLCVATLLELGVERPADHIALVARGRVATLLATPTPFSAIDVAKIREVSSRYWFELLLAPDQSPPDPRLRRIVESRSRDELALAVADPDLDLSPATDERPYFFNMLKPFSHLRPGRGMPGGLGERASGVILGNMLATRTLMALLWVALALVLCIIGVPLLWTGLPRMSGRAFAVAIAYFAGIGYGFMSVQIPFLQRFSVFVGHPIYTYSLILFTMILFAGIGSLASDRVSLDGRRWHLLVPVAIAALIGLLLLVLAPILRASAHLGLFERCMIVVATVAPLSALLGCCFPFGMRLVDRISSDATSWMWGVNGACGVLASIVAVWISMSWGIPTNLAIAAALYLLVALLAGGLAREAFR